MSRRDPKALQAEIAWAEARLAELEDERSHMSRHLSELKAELLSVQMAEGQRQPPQQTALPTRSAPLTSAEKVALFMELFRGRADVYPRSLSDLGLRHEGKRDRGQMIGPVRGE